MSDATMTEKTYIDLAQASHAAMTLIETHIARLLWDERYGTDTATDKLETIWDTARPKLRDWTLVEMRALQVVRQAALQVLDKIDGVISFDESEPSDE